MSEPGGAEVVLASASAIRRELLTRAGVALSVEVAQLDEPALMRRLKAEQPPLGPIDVARLLSCAKADEVSARRPEAWVIGADQVLALGSEIVTKAPDRDAARQALLRLRGRTHHLHSAVAVARGGRTIWSDVDSAALTVRDFSDHWLEAYLDAAGEALTRSVGAYQLEGLGVQLFEHIEGSYFTILGLPLLPLLAVLRRERIISS